VGSTNVSVSVACVSLTTVMATLTWDNFAGPSTVAVQLTGDPMAGTPANITSSATASEGVATNGAYETEITFSNPLPPGSYDTSYAAGALHCCAVGQTSAGVVQFPPFDMDVYCGYENLSFSYPNGSACTFTLTEPGGPPNTYGGSGAALSQVTVPEGTLVHCNANCTLGGAPVVCGPQQTYVIQCQ
jgi:hypothetical protein